MSRNKNTQHPANNTQHPAQHRSARRMQMGGPMGGMGMPVQKAKDFKGTFKRLLRYLKPHRTKLAIVLIFAIASTAFTIAAPKIMSKGMNKLQNAYMADQMLNTMGKAQRESTDAIYKAIAIQLYQGVSKGQKAAVDQIVSQMGEAQRSMTAALQQQLQQMQMQQAAQGGTQAGPPAGAQGAQAQGAPVQGAPGMQAQGSQAGAPGMDADTLAAIQRLLKLPMINSQNTTAGKIDATLQFIDTLRSLPEGMLSAGKQGSSYAAVDRKTLDSMKQLLSIPMLESAATPDQRTDIIRKFLDISQSLPESGGQTQDSPMEIDDAMMKKALAKIPEITDFSAGADSEKMPGNMNPESENDLKAFLDLPMLDTLTDRNQKADVSRQLIDLGKKMSALMGGETVSPRDDIKYTDEQVDAVIEAIRETNGEYDFKYIGMIVLILIGVYLFSSLFSLIMGLVMSGVAQNTVRDLRKEVDSKLSRLPLKYFDMHSHGDILSRVTNDIDTISGTLQQSLTQVITSLVTIIGYIIMMITISPILTAIMIATMPLYMVATMMIAKKSQKYFAAQQKELGDLSGHVEEMYAGHKIVKAFGREKDSVETFESINGRLQTAGWKAQFVSGIMFPVMNFISNLGYVGISVVGGIWITRSILGVGDILAFIQYSRSLTMPIVQTANIANIIQSTVACAERVFEVLDEEEEIPDSADAVTLTAPRGEVRFEHVDFRYKEDVPLIEDMDLDVRQGHTIAIVGPTGAGKTTLVNLLMRFYEINAGKISVDEVDIRKIKRSELRKLFGMVLQDTWLFNGSIRDNIAYGKEGAAMDEIVTAAKAAHADRFIRTLPEGYDTILNEEATNISQGQKQLLTIARAILANPPILILDEATSSVDTRTEVLIQKAMANLMKARTSFVIAHRLSTIRDAEQILVMNNGSIIEMGNHKELLAKGGFYADIYNSQFAGADFDSKVI